MTSAAIVDFNLLQSWIVANPEVIEPGLVLFDKQLEMGHGLSVPVYGYDPFGRPCLCMIHPTLDSTVFEKMLEVVAQLQSEGRRYRPLFSAPTKPRVFLITSAISYELRQRLDLLAGAFMLRTYVVSDSLPGEVTPSIHLEDPLSHCGPDYLLSQLPEKISPQVVRLINACNALEPPILLQGHDWPIIFVNKKGPIASLHHDEDGLIFSRPHSSEGSTALRLSDDEVIDSAIDYMMRCQINSERSDS
ncbi:MAG: hypothetical protein QGF46_00075 [Planctomycetota bacterium]|nr:hypothetical protein [Planctomycetota bacterium]